MYKGYSMAEASNPISSYVGLLLALCRSLTVETCHHAAPAILRISVAPALKYCMCFATISAALSTACLARMCE